MFMAAAAKDCCINNIFQGSGYYSLGRTIPLCIQFLRSLSRTLHNFLFSSDGLGCVDFSWSIPEA